MEIYVAEKTGDSVTLGLKDADLTVIQPLMDSLYENKDVLLVRFIEEHPELADRLLYVKVGKGDALAAIKEAAENLSGYYSEIVQ
ncbi:MAG: RpoL/Rpb11 RNA polymerase subunit family protein [Candidatus Methanomethylophilaceae archaeon]|jgi:DNA-directed RNA polymerase subunit L